MVGMDHGPSESVETETAEMAARNARRGMVLFLVYLAFYATYVVLVAFQPDVMRQQPLAGINTAILYGFGLIVAALLLALVYGWLCRAPRGAVAQSTNDSTRTGNEQ
ncbi:MAG: DUF485 domain-containing protein [Planctomycetes bacterium]|nr:DUF485 domain-containing protein [Planctomycetota bacterium]